MVSLEGARYAWPGFELRVDRWSVPAGARACVLGPSGCGKSTLLRLVSGELRASAGRVAVDGRALGDLSEAARRAWRLARVGFIFQDFPLVDYLDALENALLPYRLGLPADPGARGRAGALLEALGLGGKLSARPGALSQGERQRVAIARALVTEPALLLADEPTTGLDPARADGVMDLLEGLRAERGMTLIMVTHDPRLRPRFDQVLELAAPVA
jgi:putative ABC transport system ATP-binding protein